MDLTTIIDYLLLSISVSVLGVWIYFAISVVRSFIYSPRLDAYKSYNEKIDIILPARNEERFIGRCLESLLSQDYKNFRIIVVDDSSTDNTANIVKEYAAKDKRVIYVHAGEKPEGWTGKNWACYQGYIRSDANLLLFTDADSIFSNKTLSLAITKFFTNSLDALTLMPRILCLDLFTKLTLPLLNNILYSRYSPLRVNDKKNKTGYFFGSFFIIKRSVYEDVGTHKGVKNELIEDGALGYKVKSAGYKIMMVRGEDHFSAIWSRDLRSLINGLGRLIMPLHMSSKKNSIGIVILIFFIFIYPLIVFIYAIVVNYQHLTLINLTTILLMIALSMLHSVNLKINILYGLGIPVGSLIIFIGFLKGIINVNKGIKWKDRIYNYSIYKTDRCSL